MDAMEMFARRIAARRMKLVNDPQGLLLPKELWSQYNMVALRYVAMCTIVIDLMHEPSQPDPARSDDDA